MNRVKAASENALAYPGVMRHIEMRMPEWSASLARDLRVPITIAEQFDEAVARADADVSLSPAGVAAAIQKAGSLALAGLARFETEHLSVLKQRIAATEAALSKATAPRRPSDPAERAGYEARLSEIRALVRPLPEAQRVAIYASSTDSAVLDALESGMTITTTKDGVAVLVPLVNDAARAAAISARAQATAPEQSELLMKLVAVAELYSTFTSASARPIFEQSGLAPSPSMLAGAQA